MKYKEITICGKQVTLGYCYATEISFKILTDIDIHDFFTEASKCLNEQPARMPDTRNTIYLIIAAMQAYCQSKDEDVLPVTDKQLMFEATVDDISTALFTIISLRMDFYHLPAGEEHKEKDDEKKGKGRKKNS